MTRIATEIVKHSVNFYRNCVLLYETTFWICLLSLLEKLLFVPFLAKANYTNNADLIFTEKKTIEDIKKSLARILF